MNTAVKGVITSPVNMESRKELGLRAGDTVRVHQRIKDKDKTRIQVFEGLVLARKHGNEAGATFTVRKVASGVGVEKIFPLYSPNIDKIEIVKRAKVRRAKLYYIREKVAREIRRQMRRMHLVEMATESEAAIAAKKEAAEAKRIEDEAKAAEVAAKKAEEEKAAEKAEETEEVRETTETTTEGEINAPIKEANKEVTKETTVEAEEDSKEEEKVEEIEKTTQVSNSDESETEADKEKKE